MIVLGLFDTVPTRFKRWGGELLGTVIESDPGYVRWMVDVAGVELLPDAMRYLEEHE